MFDSGTASQRRISSETFERADRRLEGVEGTIAGVEGELHRMGQRLEVAEGAIGRVEGVLDRIDERLGKAEIWRSSTTVIVLRMPTSRSGTVKLTKF